MRRSFPNRNRSRSRSGSRTPPVREKKPEKKIVNMLDTTAVQEAREYKKRPMSERVTGRGGFGGGPRITCTIDVHGARGSMGGRVTGGRFDGNRSFGGFSGDRQVNVRHDGGRQSFGGRPRDDDEELNSFKRRREEEEGERPTMKLVDPSVVPRSARYFGHDDRSRDKNEWRGRQMYDPRKDTGRFNRDHREGGGRYGDRGGYDDRRRRDDDRRGGGWDGFGSSYGSRNGSGANNGDRGGFGGSGRYRSEPSRADGVWSHDMFIETDNEEPDTTQEDDGVLVVDSNVKSDARVVE